MFYTLTFESEYEIHEGYEDGRDGEADDTDHDEDQGHGVHTHGVTGAGQGHDGGAVPLGPGDQHHQRPGGLEGQSPDV